MHVAIDAIPLLLRSAGVKTYVYHWVRALLEQAEGRRLSMFPAIPALGACEHERSMLGRPATMARMAYLQLANRTPLPVIDWFGPRADLFHCSHQLLAPPRKPRLTATIYDLTCWLVPETHKPSNVAYAKRFAELVLKRAGGLIAISENTRSDAVRILRLDPERIAVVYPGVPDEYSDVPCDAIEAARRRYGIPGRYLLFVGTIEPRKNVPVLLDAYEQLPRSLRDEAALVVAGPAGWRDSGTLARLESGAAGVRYLGYVPEADLPGLMTGASAFVYPSLYEGFGFPLAQAMAAGVPSITSCTSCLPEVAGDAALIVDPHSPAELAGALERLLTSPALAADLSLRARARARQYRWDVAALQSWRFFEKVRGAG